MDASRIWQWFQKYYEAEYGKCKLLSIKGEGNVQLGGRFLEKPEFKKDLWIAASLDLSWTNQAEKESKRL